MRRAYCVCNEDEPHSGDGMTWDLPEVRPDKRAGEDKHADIGEQVLAEAVSRWRLGLAREIFNIWVWCLDLIPRRGRDRDWG